MGVNDIKEEYTWKGLFLRRYDLHGGIFFVCVPSLRVGDIAILFLA